MSARDWEEIDFVEDANGIRAVISRHRTRLGKFAVALYQTFKRTPRLDGAAAPRPPGKDDKNMTIWIDHDSLEQAAEVLKLAKQRIAGHIKRMLDAAVPTPASNKIRQR